MGMLFSISPLYLSMEFAFWKYLYLSSISILGALKVLDAHKYYPTISVHFEV